MKCTDSIMNSKLFCLLTCVIASQLINQCTNILNYSTYSAVLYTPLPSTINPDEKGCLIASKRIKESAKHILYLTPTRRKIRLADGNAKCRHLIKLSCTGTLRQVFICLRHRTPYPPPISNLWTLINTCREVPLQVNFFRWRHFALVSIQLISPCSHSNITPPPFPLLLLSTDAYVVLPKMSLKSSLTICHCNRWIVYSPPPPLLLPYPSPPIPLMLPL